MKEFKLENGDSVFVRASVSYPIYNRYLAAMAKMVRLQGFKSFDDYDKAEIKTDVPFTAKLEYIPTMVKEIRKSDGSSLTTKADISAYFEDNLSVLDGHKLSEIIDKMFDEEAAKMRDANKKK